MLVVVAARLVALVALVTVVSAWSGDTRARMVVDYLKQHSDEVRTFLGNQTHSDHFKLLRQDGNSLLIGARNIVYNISLDDLRENQRQRITWTSRERDTELCLVKGKSDDDCNNYIRVLAKTEEGQLLVCGTNSYNPRCRYYKENDKGLYDVEREFSGKGYCPYDPRHNSTSIFADGKLYSGTVSDFSGSDALIIKDQIRTEQYNLNHLNAPNFVSAMEDEDFVYMTFREEAVEYMNCGKAVYSRIGRVCKKDQGGPHTFKNKWTTFLKTRLNCSMPGFFPFYFDEVQAMSQVVDRKDDALIFGVFNTPENSVAGSAICSFRMSDIKKSFEGAFKTQENANSNWLPLSKNKEPSTRPGSCNNDSRSLDESHLNFIKQNVLMDEAVTSSIHMPHFVKTSLHERLTTIAVDSNVLTPNGDTVDVLFIGTTKGRVLKLVSHEVNGESQTTLIEDMQVFPFHVAVNNIIVTKSKDGASIVVLSDHEVKSVPVQRCHSGSIRSCGECVGLQDPYCAWNLLEEKCSVHRGSDQDSSSLLQNIAVGRHDGCPGSTIDKARHIARIDSEEVQRELEILIDAEEHEMLGPIERPYTKARESMYSEKTLSLACVSAALSALFVGFFVGYLFSRKCHRSDSYLKCGHAYLESQGLDRLGKEQCLPTSNPLDSGYSTTASTTKNNLLINLPVKSDTLKNNLTVTSNGTLGKCKKIYI